jgi:D-alanine transaminase
MKDLRLKAIYNQTQVFLDELMVPANDRAYLFGDAVYEVLRVYHTKPFLLAEHMARLARSLDAMEIKGVSDIRADILSSIALNEIEEGMVYVQISRGNAPRNHSFYNQALTPNILISAKPFLTHPTLKEAECGITVITHEDFRWGRCDIKTVNLLANCLAQSKAHSLGADDAIFIRDGHVTEGSSSNVFLVKDGTIKTPPLSRHILPGIRRQFLINAFCAEGNPVIEQPIHEEELFLADEVFITSTIKEAISVTMIDNKPVGSGERTIATLARKLIVDRAQL